MTVVKPKAFIFDLNGTMIDDMEYHVKGWYNILNDDLGAGLSWEDVRKQMYGKNSELLIRVFGEGRFTQKEIEELSLEKERRYQQAYMPKLALINGLTSFLQKAKERNILMAVGSAAIPFNIDFVLDSLNIRHYFNAIVSADDVVSSKPHPETFIKCASLLGIDAADCIVFEDAPKGVEAALNAQMKTVVITTMHGNDAFNYPNAIRFIQDYTDSFLDEFFI